MRPSDRVFDTPVSRSHASSALNAVHIAHDRGQLNKHTARKAYYSFLLQNRKGIFSAIINRLDVVMKTLVFPLTYKPNKTC